jgi:hypothetical protein
VPSPQQFFNRVAADVAGPADDQNFHPILDLGFWILDWQMLELWKCNAFSVNPKSKIQDPKSG